MSRLDEKLAALRAAKKKALVAYLCVGDPSVEESAEFALACAAAGADVLELGVPFSDPTADGPVIAAASQRALERGGGLAATLRAAAAVRARTDTPIVLFGYYNPIFVHGEARVVAEAKRAGVDGLLVVDLPVEEAGPLRALAKEDGLSVLPLLTPTSAAPRVERTREAIAACDPGFVYYVSLTGVTGSAAAPLAAASARAGELREALGAPVLVGFGVDGRERARAAAAHADGVIVGTALVRCVQNATTLTARVAAVTRLVRELREGVDAAAHADRVR